MRIKIIRILFINSWCTIYGFCYFNISDKEKMLKWGCQYVTIISRQFYKLLLYLVLYLLFWNTAVYINNAYRCKI